MFKQMRLLLIVILTILLSMPLDINCQSNEKKLHSPSEIIMIAKNSELTYLISILKDSIFSEYLFNKINTRFFYRTATGGSISTLSYNFSSKIEEDIKKGLELLASYQIDSAIKIYKKILELDSNNFYVITSIGQCYETKKDNLEAIKWFQLAINKNFIDYLAHWFLADNSFALDNDEKAINEICIAKILNRNNPRLDNSFKIILGAKGITIKDWYFNPQMKIEKKSEMEINIEADSCWFGYAIAKAVWQYEPGYKEKMGVSDNTYSIIEDLECISVLLSKYNNNEGTDCQNLPQFYTLRKAVMEGYAYEFILYEIILPKDPFVAYQLPEKTIERIKDYMLKVRYVKE